MAARALNEMDPPMPGPHTGWLPVRGGAAAGSFAGRFGEEDGRELIFPAQG